MNPRHRSPRTGEPLAGPESLLLRGPDLPVQVVRVKPRRPLPALGDVELFALHVAGVRSIADRDAVLGDVPAARKLVPIGDVVGIQAPQCRVSILGRPLPAADTAGVTVPLEHRRSERCSDILLAHHPPHAVQVYSVAPERVR